MSLPCHTILSAPALCICKSAPLGCEADMVVELTAWGHDSTDFNVYVDPALVPGSKEGDFAELSLLKKATSNEYDPSMPGIQQTMRPSSSGSTYPHKSTNSKRALKPEKKNLYFRITKPKASAGSASSTLPSLPAVSVNSLVLAKLGIQSRSQVFVRLLKREEDRSKVYLDVVEIHFKGVNLTRNDHYKIAKSITGRCVNCGQRIGYLNNLVRLTVDTLFRGGKRKFSGYIGDDTRFVFRSDSARILIFIQMSSEMWNFDESGDIMFHRLVNSFIPEMLHRWHNQGDSHLVSIVLFTSVSLRGQKRGHLERLGAGILEEESSHFYRVVVDSVHISRWSDIMRTLRTEFERFPQEVLEDPETHELLGYFLPSSKSNLLEAFSLATTLLTSKFVDRDLCRTGVQAMVATAGHACFDVDLSELWQLSRRLLSVEIGIELVCLARPPLHITPLFRALMPCPESANTNLEPHVSLGNWRLPANSRLVFCVPTWINMSFWVSTDRYIKQWVPRCRIYDIQMAGLIANEARTLGLKSFHFDSHELTHAFMRSFDASVFKSVDMIESQKHIEQVAESADSMELRPKSEILDKGTPASAVTTIAVAIPEKVGFSLSPPLAYDKGEYRKHTDAERNSLSSNSSMNARYRTTKARGVAKSSLGALLGLRRGTESDKTVNKPQKQPTKWSLPPSIPAKQKECYGRHNSKSHANSITTQSIPISGASVSKKPDLYQYLESPVFIRNPAHNFEHTRINSRIARPFYHSSPSAGRTSGPELSETSPSRRSFHRRGSLGTRKFAKSPEFERGPLSNLATGSNNASTLNNSCDTSRPELQNPAMWRVLPNSATIDDPSRVAAYGRWANVYPPKRKLNGVSWHSLKSPASLPLTSESFPDLESFHEQYKFQFYDVAVDSDDMSLPLLLDEMIGLRLQLGFQIAVGKNVKLAEASLTRGNANRISVVVPTSAQECIGIRIYLIRMGLVHRLAVDDEHTVNVGLYTWIGRNAKWLRGPQHDHIKEVIKVKSCYDTAYRNINKTFMERSVRHFNWSMLDQQLSGAEDPLLYPSSANTQNLVTIRYVLLPVDTAVIQGHDTLTAEESHVEGITRAIRQLLRYREAGSIDSDFIVHYYTGKLANNISEIVQDSNSFLELNRLNKSISLEDLAAEMRGAMGLQFRDRRWHWKHFKHVFTGHDFVVWLVKTFADINNAEEAEQFGVELMRKGLIRHPENRHPFIQGHYFYELIPGYKHEDSNDGSAKLSNSGGEPADQTLSRDTRESKSLKSNTNSQGKSKDISPNQVGHTSQQSSKASAPVFKQSRAKIHVSDSFVINIDPKGLTGRPERVKVSIDRMHNPKNAFHLLVEWLSVTPKLVDEVFSSVGRLASQYGLRLVQVPVADFSDSLEASPFRTVLRVNLSIEARDQEESKWFRHYLLKRSGYVLDIYDAQDIINDEYEILFFWGKLHSHLPQYIHSSGYVLVQVDNDGQLCITSNTLHLSGAVLSGNSAASSADGECESLMNALVDLCHDSEKLKVLLKEGREHRLQAKLVTSVSVLQTGNKQ